jgi:undecaprenyl-diphosphatase
MTDLLAALLLGIIEGITEFLPISSTGHLLIAERWLGHRSDLFNIAIQAGAILAVVVIYRSACGNWPTASCIPRRRTGARTGAARLRVQAAAAFGVTAVLGHRGEEARLRIAGRRRTGRVGAGDRRGVDVARRTFRGAPRDGARRAHDITWTVAMLVGVAQVVAGVFPGTSRSAATIFVALLFGVTSRAAATEFAFLVGIPTMFAATAYELLHVARDGGLAGEDWNALAVAFVASAVTAFVAVKWLLRYIQTHRFTVFAVYRVVLGAALLLLVPAPSRYSVRVCPPSTSTIAPCM